MADFFSEKRNVCRLLVALVVLVWSFGTLRYGFYVDENGLLSIYKGIYQGQRMFVDSWESLQTGGLLAYPLFALYYQVLSPIFASASINIGLVLYMRYCYMFVRLLVAIYLFYTLKNSDYSDGAFPAALFYYMFIVGWKNFSYKSYCDFAMALILCFVFRYYETRRVRYAVFMAIAACVAVLAYPTMIIMAVFLGIYWLFLTIRDEASARTVIGYVVTCLVIGGAVVLYLQFTSGWSNIIANISYLGDQDYDQTLLVRLGMMIASYAAVAVVAYVPIIFITIVRKFRYFSDESEKIFLTLYFIIFFVAICALRVDSISTSRFVYGCLIIFFWFPYLERNREDSSVVKIGSYGVGQNKSRTILWTVFMFSVVAQLVWAISTNQDISVPGHMSVYVVIACLLLFNEEYGDNEMITLSRFLIIVDMLFMGVWVANSNGGLCHVFEKMYYVEEGELSGIALLPEDYEDNVSLMNVLENVSADDNLLVAFGSNCAGYLNSDAWQGTYSVYARTQANTKLLDYYELNPDNQADYVVIDEGNIKYDLFLECETGQYILDTYTVEVARDGDFVLLSKEVQ